MLFRSEIDRQVDEFLRRGGDITAVPPGHSQQDAVVPQHRSLFDKPRENRTYLPEVIAAIESRKREQVRPAQRSKTVARPQKKFIYDDFGELIREVWVDDSNR